jgi:hypothetical protein
MPCRSIPLRPSAGAVRLTADQAERAGYRIRVIDVDPGQAVPEAGLYADGCTRMVVDDDHGYLLGVTLVGPGMQELIHSATIARGRPGTDQPALARRPLLPLHQRSLASPPRGLPGLSQALAIAPSRAAVGCLSRTGRGACPRSTVMPPRARCARVRLSQLDDVNAL